ncbi:MAG: Sybindin-like family-domain-containing protein, partial [Olpidium bornovanus]
RLCIDHNGRVKVRKAADATPAGLALETRKRKKRKRENGMSKRRRLSPHRPGSPRVAADRPFPTPALPPREPVRCFRRREVKLEKCRLTPRASPCSPPTHFWPAPAIYNLYIFDRHCQLVFYQDWHRQSRSLAAPGTAAGAAQQQQQQPTNVAPGAPTGASDGTAGGVATELTDMSLEEEAKLVYGVVFSLRNLVNKLSGKPLGNPVAGGAALRRLTIPAYKSSSDSFLAYRTSAYKLHYFETPTGLRFVLNTDPTVETEPMREVLRQIYTHIYVEYVVKNPLVKIDRQLISNEYFKNELNRYIGSLPIF